HQRGVDPGKLRIPPRHVRRLEQLHAQPARSLMSLIVTTVKRSARVVVSAKHSNRTYYALGRVLDQRELGAVAEEFIGGEDCPRQLFDRMVVRKIHAGQAVDGALVRR